MVLNYTLADISEQSMLKMHTLEIRLYVVCAVLRGITFIACGYIWSCIVESRNDEFELFGFTIDWRAHLDPPIPAAYFGNYVTFCGNMDKTKLLMGKEGFVNAAKLLGECLHETFTDKDGIVKDLGSFEDFLSELKPTTMIGVAGSPKLKFYDLDFGWGKPNKHETLSIDYNGSISMAACKDQSEDLEIGVCLSATEMEVFVRIFNDALETHLGYSDP
uniref:Uncharacterized protein n=1 Tax=Lactuca sativa TaxID=4236 RepID=A0A9R1ULY4_LACSA|nr:hypothetical protein LSAT_V11C800441930 [Lactuca sativa]